MNAAKAKNGSKGRKQIKPAPGVVGALAGSVKGIQAQALKALESAPSLKAAKDGRTLAVKMLRELHGLHGKKLEGEFMAVPVLPAGEDDGIEGPTICRTGKQSTLISDAIAAAYESAPEVRAGFMQILTDYIGTGTLIGERNLNAYDKWEKAGLFDAASPTSAKKALKMLAAASRKAPILETEKDGRLYAIALLEAMEEECEESCPFSPFSAESEERDSSSAGQAQNLMLIYRKGPQSDTLKRWMDELYQYGTPAALGGFYVVMSDYLGTVMEGSVPNAEFYVEQEQAGAFQPWGGVIYTHPELAKAAIEAGESAYRIGGKSEPKQPEATKRTAKAQEMAEAMMKECATAVYALLDFSKHYADNAINGMTAKESVCALTGKVRSAIVDFRSAARNTKASAEINAAIIAIEDLEQFMFAAASEDAGGEPLDLSKRGQARCMFAFAMDAAQAIERAQIAIGARPNEGFLQNSYNPSEYL